MSKQNGKVEDGLVLADDATTLTVFGQTVDVQPPPMHRATHANRVTKRTYNKYVKTYRDAVDAFRNSPSENEAAKRKAVVEKTGEWFKTAVIAEKPDRGRKRAKSAERQKERAELSATDNSAMARARESERRADKARRRMNDMMAAVNGGNNVYAQRSITRCSEDMYIHSDIVDMLKDFGAEFMTGGERLWLHSAIRGPREYYAFLYRNEETYNERTDTTRFRKLYTVVSGDGRGNVAVHLIDVSMNEVLAFVAGIARAHFEEYFVRSGSDDILSIALRRYAKELLRG